MRWFHPRPQTQACGLSPQVFIMASDLRLLTSQLRSLPLISVGDLTTSRPTWSPFSDLTAQPLLGALGDTSSSPRGGVANNSCWGPFVDPSPRLPWGAQPGGHFPRSLRLPPGCHHFPPGGTSSSALPPPRSAATQQGHILRVPGNRASCLPAPQRGRRSVWGSGSVHRTESQCGHHGAKLIVQLLPSGVSTAHLSSRPRTQRDSPTRRDQGTVARPRVGGISTTESGRGGTLLPSLPTQREKIHDDKKGQPTADISTPNFYVPRSAYK